MAFAISAACLLLLVTSRAVPKTADERIPGTVEPTPIPVLEKYKVARGYIEHENGLVAARIGWFLTTQGFLFTAFFLAAQIPWRMKSGFSGDGLAYLGFVGATVVAMLGMATAWLVRLLLQLALEELARIQLWSAHWQPDDRSLPKVVRETQGGLTADTFAWVFVIVWGVLLTAFVLAFLHSAWQLGPRGALGILALATLAAFIVHLWRRPPTGWIPVLSRTNGSGPAQGKGPQWTLDVDVVPVAGLAYKVRHDTDLFQREPTKRAREMRRQAGAPAVAGKQTMVLRQGTRVKVDKVCRIDEKAGDASDSISIWAHVERLPN